MPSESPVQRRENLVFDNIIPYDMQADDQVEEIINQILDGEIENLLRNVISRS